MTRLALSAALVALIALGGWGWAQSQRADRATERAVSAEQRAVTAEAAAAASRRLAQAERARAVVRRGFDQRLEERDDAPVSDLLRDGLGWLRDTARPADPAGAGADLPRP